MWLIIAGDWGGSHSRPGASSRALFSLVFLLSSAAKQGKNKQGCAACTPTPLLSAPGAHSFPHSPWECCRVHHCHTMAGLCSHTGRTNLSLSPNCESCCSTLVTSSDPARAGPWHNLCWAGVGLEAATPSQGCGMRQRAGHCANKWGDTTVMDGRSTGPAVIPALAGWKGLMQPLALALQFLCCTGQLEAEICRHSARG